MSWIETGMGNKFDVKDVDPDAIDIKDIVHSLSRLCRFNGHCTKFYSVAQHSTILTRCMHTEKLKKIALLHDASEAYLSDIARPVKVLLPDYQKLEKNLQGAIYKKFGVTPTKSEDKLIKFWDTALLWTEAIELGFEHIDDWGFEHICTCPVYLGKGGFQPKDSICAALEFEKACMQAGFYQK